MAKVTKIICDHCAVEDSPDVAVHPIKVYVAKARINTDLCDSCMNVLRDVIVDFAFADKPK